MRRSPRRRLLAGLAALTLSGGVLAEQAEQPASEAPSQASQAQDAQQLVQGRVQSINRQQSTITLLESGKTFRVGPSTGVYKNNSIGTLDAIHPGDHVLAIYHAHPGDPASPIPTLEQLKAWTSTPIGGSHPK